MKYLITTFGCQSNIADSEKIAKTLENIGYKKAENLDDLISISAQNPVLIFNTCSVRQKAEDRVFGLNNKLEKLKQKSPALKIILTGCMMHYSEKELKKRLPLFDYFINIKEIDSLPKLLKVKKERILNMTDKQRSHFNGHILNNKKGGSEISTLISISNGCDNFCSYCVVPFARGREISRPVEEILNETKKAVVNGAKEIWLLGQTVNSYRYNLKSKKSNLKNEKIRFHELLKIINSIPGDFWIRFASPHPKDFSDELIAAMAECEKFARYVNLPVQSGNNIILKKMRRPYTVGYYKKLVAKIRKAMPNIAISTDVIVGFPDETKKQFDGTIKLFKEIKFDMAFISEYSPRPKTAAAKMFKDDVSRKEKERRKNELNEILKITAMENNKKLVGKIVKVLNSRTEGNKSIEISEKYPKNQFVSVMVTKANIWSLKGKLL